MRSNLSGQTVVEVLVALGAAVVVVTAIAVVVISAVNNTEFSKSQNMATQYAQQGMEVLRQVRDSDYALFKTYDGTYCLDQDETTLGQAAVDCTAPNVDDFIRKVVVDQSGCSNGASPKLAKATVTVSWTDGKCTSGSIYCHEVDLATCLGPAIGQVPTP